MGKVGSPKVLNADVKAAVGARIRRQRKKLHLTRKELAKEIGAEYQTVRNWETGYTSVARSLRQYVADALKMPYAELFWWDLPDRATRTATMQTMDLSQRLVYLRESRKMLTGEVADLIGRSRTFVYEYEIGRRNAWQMRDGEEVLQAFADAFGVSVDELLVS